MSLTDLQIGSWNVLGMNIPPTIGDIRYLVASASDKYASKLKSLGIENSKIYTSLAEAEDDMVGDQGDTLVVFPGNHLVSASITWDKNDTRIIGWGSPNQGYQPSTLTSGGARLTCVTTSITQILNITGHYVQMYNIGTQNTYSSANNVCDIKVAGKNFYARNCSFRGGTGASQINAAHAGIPLVVDMSVAGAGNAMWIDHCLLGSSGNTIRTAGTGCFEAYAASPEVGGFGMQFTDCRFSTYSATAGVVAVSISGPFNFDRELYFKNCMFFCFNNMSTNLDHVFDMDSLGASVGWVFLHGCAAMGFDNWATAGSHMYVANGAAANGNAGISAVVADS